MQHNIWNTVSSIEARVRVLENQLTLRHPFVIYLQRKEEQNDIDLWAKLRERVEEYLENGNEGVYKRAIIEVIPKEKRKDYWEIISDTAKGAGDWEWEWSYEKLIKEEVDR